MTMKTYLALALLVTVLTVNAYGDDEIYYCAETERNGFNSDNKFKKYKNAIFIDIGCGMSGLAGTVETNRPYFGNWINYRIKQYDYSKIDKISQD